jgi:hypothetical protein
MLSREDMDFIQASLRELARMDRDRLERLREEIRGLRDEVRSIRPRATTTMALVAADAGESLIAFAPHLFYALRVTDSSGQTPFRAVLTRWMDVEALNRRRPSGSGSWESRARERLTTRIHVIREAPGPDALSLAGRREASAHDREL